MRSDHGAGVPESPDPSAREGAGADPETLADAFWSVARRLRSSSRETLTPFDLTPSQMRALRAVMHHGDMRLGMLSEHLRIAARSTTEVVDGLESSGLLTRQPDPSDRRATVVTVSDHGREVMAAVRAARQAESAQLFDRLTAAERASLARLLAKLAG